MFTTTIHWIQDIAPHRLGLMARPCGGERLAEEVQAWRAASVDVVVSLLESHEVRELELKAEQALCALQGMAFRAFPIPDRGTPSSLKEAADLLNELHTSLVEGKTVAIHCRAGIGRTGLVAAGLLHRLRVPRQDIFQVLSRSRGVAMPDTPEQVAWVERYVRAFPHPPGLSAGRHPGGWA